MPACRRCRIISNFGVAHHDVRRVVISKKPRDVWPDATKGICIILVVLVHLVSKHYVALDWDLPVPLALGWKGITSVMEPIRMPLFFAISGYFSVSYFTRPWRSIAEKRVIPVYLLYVLWLIIYSVFFASVSSPLIADEDHGLVGLFLAFVLGYTGLWYLYALPVYLVLARICALAPRVSLALAAVVSLMSASTIFPEIGNTPSLLRNFFYFLAGALLARYIARMAHQRVTLRVGALTTLFIVVSVAHALGRFATQRGSIPVDLGLAALQMAASVAGVIVGVILISALARTLPGAAVALAWLGQRTLPIYVLHLPLLALMSIVLNGISPPLPVAAIYPAFATIVIVYMCLGVSRVITVAGGGWLFDPTALRRGSRSNSSP
jgi:fucose 4-O-acetylase-like acetyltransferase